MKLTALWGRPPTEYPKWSFGSSSRATLRVSQKYEISGLTPDLLVQNCNLTRPSGVGVHLMFEKYWPSPLLNAFEYQKIMRWMKLEPIIQSEVSQKEKHQYSILMRIYGIQKDGNDNPVCETEKETQMYRTVFWTLWERARVG